MSIKSKIKIKEPKFLDQYKAEEEAFPTDDVVRFEEQDEKEYKISFEVLAAHRNQTTTRSPASLGGCP